MSKPLAKLGARCHVLQPRAKTQGFLFDPTGPETLHQKARAVLWSRRLVYSLELNHFGLHRERADAKAGLAIRRRILQSRFNPSALLTLDYIIGATILADIESPLRVE
jgi:hypothetical protein